MINHTNMTQETIFMYIYIYMHPYIYIGTPMYIRMKLPREHSWLYAKITNSAFTFRAVPWTGQWFKFVLRHDVIIWCWKITPNFRAIHFVRGPCNTSGARFTKNIERHTADTIVSWPNPKQWVIVHTSDLMMIIRQSIYILSVITTEMGKLKTYSPTYCIMDNGENMLNLTHTLDKIYLTGIL